MVTMLVLVHAKADVVEPRAEVTLLCFVHSVWHNSVGGCFYCSLRWLVTTWLSSASHTSQWSTADRALVPHTHHVSSHSS